uniref:Uncharacterized protein n=1 Tax=Anguilla anguilla TaxID=7936 RepID=A0A0E9P689_ANGAN
MDSFKAKRDNVIVKVSRKLKSVNSKLTCCFKTFFKHSRTAGKYF